MSFVHGGDVVGMKQGSHDRRAILARRLPSLYSRVNRQIAWLGYLCFSTRRQLFQNLNAPKTYVQTFELNHLTDD
jgi:hypothetical protein